MTAPLHRYREEAARQKDLLLGHLLMLGEIPAPTGGEAARIEALLQRWSDSGLDECAADSFGNATALLRGSAGGPPIVLSAHADTFVTDLADQTIEVTKDHIIGPFVGDNSPALAAMSVLPALLERTGLRLRSDLLLLAPVRMLGRGNLEGLRSFLGSYPRTIKAGLCVESVQLGRLNYSCLGVRRGEVVCRLPENYNWSQFVATGAIIPMAEVIARFGQIPLPRQPRTGLVLGSVEGGLSYSNIAREALLKFELRGEDAAVLDKVQKQMQDAALDVASHSGVRFDFDVFVRREPGSLGIDHPLVETGRRILRDLDIEPMLYPTTSALSAFIERRIPAVTIGLTRGERRHTLDEIDELFEIAPLCDGLAQLVALIEAIDAGDWS
jgi:di/tripeptidase